MPRLNKEDQAKIEAEIRGGNHYAPDLAKKYNIDWKNAKKYVQKFKDAPQKTEAVQTTIAAPAKSEEREVLRIPVRNSDKPTLSLIETPQAVAPQPIAPPSNSNVLDGSKFYCGTCLRQHNRQTILSTDMTACPSCNGVLQWAN